MFKAVTFLLGITLLTATPVMEVPQTFFSDNYSGLKEFVQGILDGYNHRQVDLPSNCLSSSQQSKLDEDFVAMGSLEDEEGPTIDTFVSNNDFCPLEESKDQF